MRTVMGDLCGAALKATDEVLGDGAYGSSTAAPLNPGAQQAIRRWPAATKSRRRPARSPSSRTRV
jgi:hypothetical protein